MKDKSPSRSGKMAIGTYEMLGNPYRKEAIYLTFFFDWLNKFKQGHDLEE